jgi:UDP:flavonoid glycosyltransferase YjiC (YdhE family)
MRKTRPRRQEDPAAKHSLHGSLSGRPRLDRRVSRVCCEPEHRLVCGLDRVLQKILDAVGGLPVRVVVMTTPAVSPGSKVPVNAELHSHLSHAEVVPTVSLEIGHAGHATTLAAVAHDLPVMVLPMAEIMDRVKIGQILDQAGAGYVHSQEVSTRTNPIGH